MSNELSNYKTALESHKEKINEYRDYSIKRLDSLSIAIAGGGIYAVLEILKFTIEQELCADTILLKIAGASFVVSVAAHLSALVSSQRANNLDLQWAEMAIDDANSTVELSESDKVSRTKKQEKLTKQVARNNNFVHAGNSFSAFGLFVGLILIMAFCWMTF